MKEYPWVEHLTSPSKREMGILLSVAAYERMPMSYLQWLNALKANNRTNNNIQQSYQWLQSQDLTAHNTLNDTILPWPCSVCCISYVHLCKNTSRLITLFFYYVYVIVISPPGGSSFYTLVSGEAWHQGGRPYPREEYSYYLTCYLGNITVEERYEQHFYILPG